MLNVEVKQSPIHGHGLFATKAFQAGDEILKINDSMNINDIEDVTETEERRFIDQLDNGSLIMMQWPEKYCNWPVKNSLGNTRIEVKNSVRVLIANINIPCGEEFSTTRMMR